MMQMCDFEQTGDSSVCKVCRFVAHYKGRVVRRCDVQPRPGLGDMVAAGLSAIGITKERVSAVVGGDCGCAKRQEALNALGRRVGIG